MVFSKQLNPHGPGPILSQLLLCVKARATLRGPFEPGTRRRFCSCPMADEEVRVLNNPHVVFLFIFVAFVFFVVKRTIRGPARRRAVWGLKLPAASCGECARCFGSFQPVNAIEAKGGKDPHLLLSMTPRGDECPCGTKVHGKRPRQRLRAQGGMERMGQGEAPD